VTIRDRIEGGLVALIPLHASSAPDWARWMNDPDTTRYLFSAGRRPATPFTVEVELDWGRRALVDSRRVMFGIEERATGRVVGNARLTPDGARGTFGIVIGEADARGRGLGREATALVCRYGFDAMGLREIRLEVDARNEPAVRAYRAVGFVDAGRNWMRLTSVPEPATVTSASRAVPD
jgi:RimJ/RimL family protein N-acetyltransferase